MVDGYPGSYYNMYIEVTGFNRKHRRLIEEAAVVFIDKLISAKTQKILEISFIGKKLCADGFCQYEDSNINPRSFIIELDKNLRGEELIKTVAHELVHVKQYVKNELRERYKPNWHHMWYNELIIVNDDNFFDVPWEIEAREMEQDLYDLFENRMINNVNND